MSETVLTLKKSNKENTGDSAQKVESFISKYRKIILAAFIAVVAAAVAVCTVVLLKNKAKNNAIAAIYDVETTYVKDVAAVEEKYAVKEESSDSEEETAVKELTEEQKAAKSDELAAAVAKAIEALGPYVSEAGVVGVRSNLLAAEIHYAAKDYLSAQDSYLAAAEKDVKAYTYPVCYSNAGSCALELGKYADAASYFEKAASVKGYILASHDMFRFAMAKELSEDYSGAVKIYQEVADKYDDEWANLAQSSIIRLSVNGKN